ncbi:MAG TPA: NAD(P)/FAD-dependent oxidoreductase [Candidatus Obscuribacterales bacterium]
MEKKTPHVVIVGAGFGGLAVARSLRNAPVRMTIVDKTNHHLFQPLLYQVAMAGLSPAEIAYPIRAIVRKQKNVTVLMEEVTAVDLERRVVLMGERELAYDFLVLAAGAQTNYFGHDDWMPYAVGLKDLDDAVEIRRRVLVAFEAAEREEEAGDRAKLLTFVIIGGGPTGVELAGSLAELARHALASDFRVINPSSAKILLLEAGNRILPSFPEELSERAVRQLERLGVQVRTGALVTGINRDGVQLKGGEFIASSTVLWCAGVSASPLTKTLGVPLDRSGRVLVEPDLSLPGHADAFAIGDLAAFLHQDGKLLPGLAPVAMQQGAFVAEAIEDTLAGKSRKRFRYVDRGSLATIGRSAAVAEFGRVRLSGFTAWLAWLLIHIFFLIGFRNRFIVFFDWLWSYLTYQRGARLITGHRMDPGAPVSGKPES